MAANFDVSTETQLRTAITTASAGDTITFQTNITLTADLPAVQTNVTIVGNNKTLSGDNQFRGLFVGAFSGSTQVPVSVTIQDLAITNTKAAGGSAVNGGGGGAGLGGALFVANHASVTASNVTLNDNNATGGSSGTNSTRNGGGGGMGGSGGAGNSSGSGGGGGLGRGADGGSGGSAGVAGIATGASSGGSGANGGGAGGSSGGGGGSGSGGAPGGGGGVGGANATLSAPGAGGFGGGSGGTSGRTAATGGFGGGGGGAAGGISRGGVGGFGGGGGSGTRFTSTGGFGGGSSGRFNQAGGGGAGMGGGAFVQQGGTLILAGSLTINGNSVNGGTGFSNGSAFGSGLFLQGNGTVTFAPGSGQSQTVSDIITDQTGSGGTGGNAGSYGLVKQGAGTLTLSTANTYTGATSVEAGTLALSGSLKSSTTVNAGATLQGTGRITGALTVAGTIAPGNGTFNVTGNYTQNAGSIYTVEVNGAGQSDLINITGVATLNGGTVSVQAAGGTYQRNTTYTILSATGGVSGTYAGVTSNFAFLTPSLSYGADSVMLTLVASANSFRDGAQTPNQSAVGAVLDQATPGATGDFANVLTALSTLDTTQGPKALEAIGGQSYSGFSSVMVLGAQLFMDSFQLQAGGGAIGGSAGLPGGSTYMALRTDAADACDAVCDVAPQWGVWGTGLGAFGTVAGDANANGLTYNLGGFIAGLDHRFGSNVRAGVATGFNAASLYAQNMPGYGTSNTLQLALYGEYAEGPFYLDALAGYAHSDNRMTRPIVIPGLPFRSAQGYTTANTVVGQLEAGYKLTVAPSFGGFVTPFARLQASTSTQNGFTETGADSLNLTVATQTTQSLRTVLGTQLGAGIDAPWREKLNLMLRLGWSHEYADLSRPVTASFAGAPTLGFTTFGAVAPRDGVVLGFGGNTAVAERTNVYLRYDGDLAGGNTNHVLSAGIRYVW